MKYLMERIKVDYKYLIVIVTALISICLNAGMMLLTDYFDVKLILKFSILLNFLVLFIFTWVFTINATQKYYEKNQTAISNPSWQGQKKIQDHVKYTVKYIEDMISNYQSIEKREGDKFYFTLQLSRIRDALLFIESNLFTGQEDQ